MTTPPSEHEQLVYRLPSLIDAGHNNESRRRARGPAAAAALMPPCAAAAAHRERRHELLFFRRARGRHTRRCFSRAPHSSPPFSTPHDTDGYRFLRRSASQPSLDKEADASRLNGPVRHGDMKLMSRRFSLQVARISAPEFLGVGQACLACQGAYCPILSSHVFANY